MAKDKNSINKELNLMQRVSDQMKRTADSLQAVEKCVNKLDKKLDLHIQKMEYELTSINEQDKEQNKLLAEHSARSDALQKDNELREQDLLAKFISYKENADERLNKLEGPRKWLKTSRNILVYVGGGTSAIYGILKLLGVI